MDTFNEIFNQLILYRSPYNKYRLGKDGDGGYVIVELPDNYDMFLSGGISNDNTFEIALLDKFKNLQCIAFDGTVENLAQNDLQNRITFIKKNIGNTSNENLTNLHEYIIPYDNIFLKLDIEGHEYRLFETFTEELLNKIKQIVIEIHTPFDIKDFPDYFYGLNNIDENNLLELLQKINKNHTLVHFHANNGCNIKTINNIQIPHVFECTFIRNDFIKIKERNKDILPTNLDSPNISDKSEYILSGFPYSF